jgi:hypothetical protein
LKWQAACSGFEKSLRDTNRFVFHRFVFPAGIVVSNVGLMMADSPIKGGVGQIACSFCSFYKVSGVSCRVDVYRMIYFLQIRKLAFWT